MLTYANTRNVHQFLNLKNFLNDTDVTQQKFISQLVIQDETLIHHFSCESEQRLLPDHTGRLMDCNFLIRSLFKDVY